MYDGCIFQCGFDCVTFLYAFHTQSERQEVLYRSIIHAYFFSVNAHVHNILLITIIIYLRRFIATFRSQLSGLSRLCALFFVVLRHSAVIHKQYSRINLKNGLLYYGGRHCGRALKPWGLLQFDSQRQVQGTYKLSLGSYSPNMVRGENYYFK